MKSVLMSIKPKYVEKIANGEKTIEVRKTRPKIETPFKVYIYCTYGNARENYCVGKRGKVIGEFTCDRIDSYVGRYENKDYWDLSVKEWEELKKKSCLTIPQILEYTGDCPRCYGWHISDLKIYDQPRELGEFKKPCDRFLDCITCKRLVRNKFLSCDNKITRPPQSWQFIESLGE